MKKYLITLIILFAGLCLQAQSSEQTVLDLSKKKFGWLIRLRYDSLESMLDDRLMFIHSSGWTENKQELIQDLKSGKLKYVNIDITESTVRVYTNAAIVTGKGKFNVVVDGNPLEINLSYTEVYVLKNGKWLLASRHSNRMP